MAITNSTITITNDFWQVGCTDHHHYFTNITIITIITTIFTTTTTIITRWAGLILEGIALPLVAAFGILGHKIIIIITMTFMRMIS